MSHSESSHAPPAELIKSIHFLRASAALMVLAFHAANTAEVYGGFTHFTSNAAAAGVDILFIISGFVITWITQNNLHQPLDFMVRRLIRVVPAYWFFTSVTLALLVAIPALAARLKPDLWHTVMSYLFVLSKNNNNDIGTLLGVGWTVCFEMYFYVVFAVMMALLGRSALYGVAVVVIVGALLQNVVNAPPFATVAASSIPLEFLAGCILAKVYMRKWFLPALPAIAAVLASSVFIYWIGSQVLVKHEYDAWRVLYFGLPSVILTAGLLSLEGRRLVTFPALMIAIGDASYSLYLSHQLLQQFIGRIWKMLGLRDALPPNLLFVIGIVAPIVAALICYRWFERPTTRWLNMKWRRRNDALATVQP